MTEYKLVTFASDQGPRAGLLIGSTVYDIAEITGQTALASLENVFADWERSDAVLGDIASSSLRNGFDLAATKVLAPLRQPGAVYCAGANYQDHIDNMARKQGVEMGKSPRDLGLPPYHFLKTVHCIAGTDTTIFFDGSALDYEGELAAVIGSVASNISVEDALSYVAGYTVANDLSARDRFVRREIPFQSPFRFDWLGHKNFDGSCPIGPFVVPARFIADPQDLRLRTWVNGEIRQDASTKGMVYSLAELIAALSVNVTLRPGDIVLTGTPAGVGAETGDFLRPGDEVKVEIEGIGILVNRISAKDSSKPRSVAKASVSGELGVVS